MKEGSGCNEKPSDETNQDDIPLPLPSRVPGRARDPPSLKGLASLPDSRDWRHLAVTDRHFGTALARRFVSKAG